MEFQRTAPLFLLRAAAAATKKSKPFPAAVCTAQIAGSPSPSLSGQAGGQPDTDNLDVGGGRCHNDKVVSALNSPSRESLCSFVRVWDGDDGGIAALIVFFRGLSCMTSRISLVFFYPLLSLSDKFMYRVRLQI